VDPTVEIAADDPQRRALIDEAARRWRGQLIDLGGRNTLLYYRDPKAGTLDLGAGDPVALAALLAGRTVALSHLFRDPEARAQALRRARTIRNKARELHEERGIETCFLAVGMATWTNPKGGAVPAAPVLLRSAVVRARGAAEDDFELDLTGDTEVNPTLLHLLATDFDLPLDGDELEELVEQRGGFDPAPLYERLTKEANGRVRGFSIVPRHVLGTFSYAKLPMVTDLLTADEVLRGHDVIAAIAGDRTAQADLRDDGVAIDPDAPDEAPPGSEYLVLDADSSQHYAINAVLAGQHTVVKGPPGTGKSQTIANLIASLVADGKRVLFVAEKRAAIAAVTDRLARRGLGHLVMDVHDGTATRRRVAAELRAAFDQAERIALPDLTDLHERLADRRARLRGYAHALHAPREPWGVSVFTARSTLVGLARSGAATSRTRWRGTELAALDEPAARRVRERLREYAGLGGLGGSASPWAGASVRTGEQAQAAYVTAEDLWRVTLPAARARLDRVLAETRLVEPQRLADRRPLFALLDGVAATLSTMRPEIYRPPLSELVAATAPRAWRKANRREVGGWFARRALRKEARALCLRRLPRTRLFEALRAAEGQLRQWLAARRDDGLPRLPSEFAEARAVQERLEARLATLGGFLPTTDLGALRPVEADRLLAALVGDERTLRRLPRLAELADAFAAQGLEPLLTELRAAGSADPERAVARFDACWYASILEHVGFADARIGAFDGDLHERVADEYRASDNAHIDTTATRVLRAVAQHVVATRDAYPDESRLVEHQANLKRRHLPMRQLFAAAPHMLTALKPCWAMSPLVVSQLLPADRQYFDVVVFDEASQVTPADAVPAIMRAKQVVVAGDEHQLPPTTFFTVADDHDDSPVGVTADGAIDPALTTGYESILDVLSALLPGYTLRWHYRSQDERLIAFSNAWVYGRSLVTFPGTTGAGRLRHVAVAQADGDAAAQDSVGAEVDRVVALALEHATAHPDESLGVITMGITHAERIDLALRRALARRPDLHGFFAESRPEPFFVKNLERVQGDERDAVILSIGYGKTPDGRLLYRFGPLLLPGGHRRLNVAVTRARRRMTLVSSFTSADMDPARSAGDGVRLLRAYLEYAESAGESLGAAAPVKPDLDPFAADVCERLAAAGIPVTAHYGVAGYFVDFAAAHPSRPGEMVLAIETDGPVYGATGTTRDRDRLREEHLERLGWEFHRIWSADWIADPVGEVAQVRAAYDLAVAAADARLGVVAAPDSPPGHVAAPGLAPDPGSGVAGAEPAPAAHSEPEPSTVDATPTVHLSALTGRPGDRPALTPGLPITAYRHADLVDLVRWIESDTLLRTEEQVLDEVMRELGFQRRGPRIRDAVTAAVREARRA
jgi:very-short-patch-repair endonuclease